MKHRLGLDKITGLQSKSGRAKTVLSEGGVPVGTPKEEKRFAAGQIWSGGRGGLPKASHMKQFASIRPRRKKVGSIEHIEQAAENAPRITNETVATHREEVLSSARRYILPLQHSKHQVVIITGTLFIAALIAFVSYCLLALYRFQSSSVFLYRVTQVVPFPIARAGNDFVSYETYLFELLRYQHFYENQQQTNFNDPTKRTQLDAFKKQALEKVIQDSYVAKLASEQGVSVTQKEVTTQLEILRSQNRLGGSTKVFEDVLQDYWGWSVADFRRSLQQQMLAQKVAQKLDTNPTKQMQAALAELKKGTDFATVAKKYSTDKATIERGGEFGFAIDRTNTNLDARTTAALFTLKPGNYSDIINLGSSLQIVKNIELNGQRVRGAHIIVQFQEVKTFTDPLKKSDPTKVYIAQ